MGGGGCGRTPSCDRGEGRWGGGEVGRWEGGVFGSLGVWALGVGRFGLFFDFLQRFCEIMLRGYSCTLFVLFCLGWVGLGWVGK